MSDMTSRALINFNTVSTGKLLWYERNKTLQDTLLRENNQPGHGKSRSTSSHRSVVDYFSI